MNDEITKIRDNDIVNTYFETLKYIRKKYPFASQDDIFRMVITSPAPRFYITYENARRFVSLIARGIDLPLTNSNKIKMYYELYRRFITEKKYGAGYSYLEKIIESPAPSFYLSEYTIRGIIYKAINNRCQL